MHNRVLHLMLCNFTLGIRSLRTDELQKAQQK